MDMGMYEYPPPSPACLESLGEVIVRGRKLHPRIMPS
jgi:hypothetical protein